ncbi:protein-export chaperone SecB [Candidatus Pseudomonas adelgestsugas]
MNKTSKNCILGASCQSILFPYVSETIDSLIARGAFLALMLILVNFNTVYAIIAIAYAVREFINNLIS